MKEITVVMFGVLKGKVWVRVHRMEYHRHDNAATIMSFARMQRNFNALTARVILAISPEGHVIVIKDRAGEASFPRAMLLLTPKNIRQVVEANLER